MCCPGNATAYTIPVEVPATLAAGDTWEWTTGFDDFPATESWLLSYAFSGPQVFTISGAQVTTSGVSYAVTVLASVTAAYAPGRYTWIAYVTTSGERHQASNGVCYVQPNVATATGDQRSIAAQSLAAIDTELLNRLTGVSAGGEGSIESYQIGNRAVHKIPTKELYQLRSLLRAEVWREQNPGRIGPPVLTRFVRPGA